MFLMAVRYLVFIIETKGGQRKGSIPSNDEGIARDSGFEESSVVLFIHYTREKDTYTVSYGTPSSPTPTRFQDVQDSSALRVLDFHIVTPENVNNFEKVITKHNVDNRLLVELRLHQRGYGSRLPITSTIVRTLSDGEKQCSSEDSLIRACSKAREAASIAKLHEVEPFEYEPALKEVDLIYDEYASIIFQLGYVAMFSICWGLLPLVALVETLLQLRGDAFVLLRKAQRPQPMPVDTVGAWGELVVFMIFLSIIVQSAVLCFTTNALVSYSTRSKFLLCFVIEHAVVAVCLSVDALVSQDPAVLQSTSDDDSSGRITKLSNICRRQDKVVAKHKNTKAHETLQPPAGSLIDVRDLSLTDVAATISDISKAKIQWLKKKLQLSDLRIGDLRRRLKRANESEAWNEETGVSEARNSPGLSLGLVNLKIIKLVGSFGDPAVLPEDIRIAVSVVDRSVSRPYKGDPGPDPVYSKEGVAEVHNGNRSTSFNQVAFL